MPVDALNTGSAANRLSGSVKGPPSDASLITAMRRAAVNVNFMHAATAGFTVGANNTKVVADRLNEKGFTESRYTSVFVGRGLTKNFLKTL